MAAPIPHERILFSPDMYEMMHFERLTGRDKDMVRVRRWQAGDWPFPRAAIQEDCRLVSDVTMHKGMARVSYEFLMGEGWARG